MTHIESCIRDRIHDDLARIARGSTPLTVSRSEILSSWQASLDAGLRPDRLVVPFEGEGDADDRLMQAARPAMDRLAIDLAHTDVSVVLSDARGRVVARHSPPSRVEELAELCLNPGYAWRLDTAGTTALGIATRSRHPVVVDGPDHFMDALAALTTASAPIQDTTTARLLGVLTLVCPATSAHALLLPVARQAAREIEGHVVDATTAPQRLLHEEFLRARRHADDRYPRSSRPSFGWDGLTDTERSLAFLIADGLTNKEAGARLFVSRHTIDSHLRHIFRKLGINSRVDLARIAAMQAVANRAVA